MNTKQKIKTFLVGSLLVISAMAYISPVASADCTPDPKKNITCCGNTQTSIIGCTQDNKGGDIQNNGVWGLLLLALNILTAGVGIAAVGGIVYGSILYTTAGDSSEKVKKAIGVIMNVVIGIVAFVAMYAILQFLIPGGIFT